MISNIRPNGREKNFREEITSELNTIKSKTHPTANSENEVNSTKLFVYAFSLSQLIQSIVVQSAV